MSISPTITVDWAPAIGKLLRSAINVVYLEFENNGGTAVTIPTAPYTSGVAYYSSLATSGTRDYLRLPTQAVLLTSNDEVNYPDGNQLQILAQTTGTTGVNGKAFNSVVSSRVFGVGVGIAADWTDQSQDLIICRYYLESDNQLVKLAGAQISVSPLILLSE